MRRRLPSLACVCAALAALASGCQSTQATSAQRAEDVKKLANPENIEIGAQSAVIKVVDTTILSDKNGTAIVATLKNESNQAFANVPVQIQVKDSKGRTVFRNNTAGLARSLLQLDLIEPHETVDWVHDQVLIVPGQAKSVRVTIGEGDPEPPSQLPKIDLGNPRVQNDPVSGIQARGTIENTSEEVLEEVTVYGVARRGGRIVAAGRGGLKKLQPHKQFFYNVYFIGNPQGADVEVAAPPPIPE